MLSFGYSLKLAQFQQKVVWSPKRSRSRGKLALAGFGQENPKRFQFLAVKSVPIPECAGV